MSKLASKIATGAALLTTLVSGAAFANGPTAAQPPPSSGAQIRASQQQQWRAARTVRGQGGRLFSRPMKTTEMTSHEQSTARSMEWLITAAGHPDTPAFQLSPAQSGVSLRLIRYPDLANSGPNNYWNGNHAIFSLEGFAGGDLHLNALMPVSGHTGQAELFKVTNKYNLIVTHPNGDVEQIDEVPTAGYVTPHALRINMQSGTTRVQFTPHETSVGGYPNGRTIDVQWGQASGK